MVNSKPRHGDPLFEQRGGQLYATPGFQRWIDDVTAQLNALEASLEALTERVEALETFHP